MTLGISLIWIKGGGGKKLMIRALGVDSGQAFCFFFFFFLSFDFLFCLSFFFFCGLYVACLGISC